MLKIKLHQSSHLLLKHFARFPTTYWRESKVLSQMSKARLLPEYSIPICAPSATPAGRNFRAPGLRAFVHAVPSAWNPPSLANSYSFLQMWLKRHLLG